MPPDLGLQGLEERGCNAWPALRSAIVGGWLLRFSEGYSKRANSGCALPGAAPLQAVLPEIEQRYARAGLPCCIRLTPLAPDGSATLLASRGWTMVDETSVQVADLAAFSPTRPPGGIVLSPRVSDSWAEGFAAASPRPDLRAASLLRMLQAIGSPTAFGTVRDPAGDPLAFGLGVLERGAVGLFDIVTAPAHRGKGHGRAMVEALLDWGRSNGAGAAYLQVTTGNVPALGLYGSLGFGEAYRYVYWRAPD